MEVGAQEVQLHTQFLLPLLVVKNSVLAEKIWIYNLHIQASIGPACDVLRPEVTGTPFL